MQFDTRLPFREALRRIPAEGLPLVTLFKDGGLTVELYTPYEIDRQRPHTRDEIYLVARGDGEFVVSGKRHPCSANDLLFVPAHVPHRFENFSDDFAVWVLSLGSERTKG